MKSVRLVVNIRDTHAMLLDALSGKQEEYQDLFSDNRITFSEAIAKLYQRINPHIDMGQRTAQTIGEELLDYRNYLELEVEVIPVVLMAVNVLKVAHYRQVKRSVRVCQSY